MEFVATEGSAEQQFELGHNPPAVPPPAPPRRQGRNKLESPAAFRVTVRRTQLRHPRPGAVGDLDPDDAVRSNSASQAGTTGIGPRAGLG